MSEAPAQLDLSVLDRRVIEASIVGHAQTIAIVNHQTKLEKDVDRKNVIVI